MATNTLNAFSAFLQWAKIIDFTVQDTELRLVSEENQFGGQIDLVGWINDELCVFDWKTSKALYLDYLIQAAAYVLLWNEWYDPEITKVHIVRFDKITGNFEHRCYDNLGPAQEMFLHLRKCYGLAKGLEKRMK